MSIYRRPGWTQGRSDVHQFKRLDTGAQIDSPATNAPSTATEWTTHRRARPAEHLLPSTERWMDQLPPEVFPAALASQFARIVNLIAIQWHDAHACPAYLEELLVERRRGRQGFPPAVKGDLQRLRAYWYGSQMALR